MQVNMIPTRTLRPAPDVRAVDIIDQTVLPHAYRILRLASLEDAAHAIRAMQVRGAPLIGVTAAYGLALARMLKRLAPLAAGERADAAWHEPRLLPRKTPRSAGASANTVTPCSVHWRQGVATWKS